MSMWAEQHTGIASALRQMLMHRYPDHFMLFVDLFAMGCLLHLQGERCAGHRLVAQVLDTASDPAERRRLTSLLHNLSGNEAMLAREIMPNPELRQLCDRMQVTHFREAACAR